VEQPVVAGEGVYMLYYRLRKKYSLLCISCINKWVNLCKKQQHI